MAWLLFCWSSSFAQFTVLAYQCSHLDNAGAETRKQLDRTISSLSHGPSPVPHLPPAMPVGFWSYSLRKFRTTNKPIWAALTAQSALNWLHLYPGANILGCTHATLRWLVAMPPALNRTHELSKCMTGYSYTAVIDLLTLKPTKRKC